MRKTTFILFSIMIFKSSFAGRLVAISQDFLLAVRSDENYQPYIDSLAKASLADLTSELNSDNTKKAFWINVYNAYVQATLKAKPDKFKKRSAFYSDKFIVVAGKKLSLDDIEHGILRRSKNKYSLGYFNTIFKSSFEKKCRVEKVDYRIHFALNCGAKSCPAVAFYDADKIDEQLQMATTGYITAESVYDKEKNTVEVPMLLKWFKADFGGKKGIYALLDKHKVIPDGKKPKITHSNYNWTMELSKYKEI